jgi:hypothetical protein
MKAPFLTPSAALVLALWQALSGFAHSQDGAASGPLLAVPPVVLAVPPVASPAAASPSPEPAAQPSGGTPAAEKTATPPLPAGVVPVPFPAQRYTALFEKSPFAIASAPPEQPVTAENFATNWVLAGISKQKGKDGAEHYTLFVRSRDLATRLVIFGDRPTEDGVSLVSVDENPVAAKSTAILRKGSETGRVEFDQAAVSASAAMPQQVQPGKPGVPAVRTSAKSIPIPRPGMQGTVPRPGASAVPPQSVPPPAAAGAPNSQEPRRRVRPIQEPP